LEEQNNSPPTPGKHFDFERDAFTVGDDLNILGDELNVNSSNGEVIFPSSELLPGNELNIQGDKLDVMIPNGVVTFPSPELSPGVSGFYIQKHNRMRSFEVPPHENIPLPHDDNVVEFPSAPFCLGVDNVVDEQAIIANFTDFCPQSPTSTVDTFSEMKFHPEVTPILIIEDQLSADLERNSPLPESHDSESFSSLKRGQVEKLSHILDNLKRLGVMKQVKLKTQLAGLTYADFKAAHAHESNMHRDFLKKYLDLMPSDDREPIRQCITAGGKNKLSVPEAIFGVALIAHLQDLRSNDQSTFQSLMIQMTRMMSKKRGKKQ